MHQTRKCQACGRKRPRIAVLFITWVCTRTDCPAKKRFLSAAGAHVHANWLCPDCRQLGLFGRA